MGVCRLCKAPRPSEKAGWEQEENKHGDWYCPNPACGDYVFGRNQQCRKCGTKKPDAAFRQPAARRVGLLELDLFARFERNVLVQDNAEAVLSAPSQSRGILLVDLLDGVQVARFEVRRGRVSAIEVS